MGKVDFDGILKKVCLAYVPEIQVGDYAIIHAGFAITQLDEQEAQETLALSREMGALEEELIAPILGTGIRSNAGAYVVKYLEEFRDPELAQRLFDELRRTARRPWALMEVCGGQTHSIIRNGIDQLLPHRSN